MAEPNTYVKVKSSIKGDHKWTQTFWNVCRIFIFFLRAAFYSMSLFSKCVSGLLQEEKAHLQGLVSVMFSLTAKNSHVGNCADCFFVSLWQGNQRMFPLIWTVTMIMRVWMKIWSIWWGGHKKTSYINEDKLLLLWKPWHKVTEQLI